jgi:hypothetical protein
MQDFPLPDDLGQWPEDPSELLGVSFGVTPRELRRAYNRLIRIYKPEQFPEQFRRIREAYEYLLRIAEWHTPHLEALDTKRDEQPRILPAPREPPSSEDAAEETGETPQPVEEVREEGILPPSVKRHKDELDELWEEAISGRPAAAYERLAQLTQQYAGRVELYQRLYWLLTLWPDLDAHRAPADWLVQGLLATGLAGPLRELYCEVVADDPAEALQERYERLLDTQASAALLADVIEWRFQAAMRLQRWDVLNTDLARLGRRFGLGEEQLWLRLLFLLADGAAWSTDDPCAQLFAACRKEISRYEPLAPKMPHLFDRFDLLLETSAGWRKLSRSDGVLLTIWRLVNTPLNAPFIKFIRRRIPANMLRLLGVAWFRPFAEVRESLMEVVQAIAGSPQKWLRHFDEMRKRAPATLALFGELLDQLEAEREEEEGYDRDKLKEIVLPFLSRLNVAELSRYETARKRLLQFCINQHIAPEEMAEISSYWTWSQRLMGDWPLRLVYRAYRLFWA